MVGGTSKKTAYIRKDEVVAIKGDASDAVPELPPASLHGDDPEISAMPWYNPATPYGIFLWWGAMAMVSVLSYKYWYAHAIVLGIMVAFFIASIVLWKQDPERYPSNWFAVAKPVSVLLGSAAILLIRLRVGPFGLDPVTSPQSDEFDDPHNISNVYAWITLNVLLIGNILEAVVAEFQQHRGIHNALVGILLCVALPTQKQYHFTVAWITAYSLWNGVFTLRRFGIRAGAVHVGHNLIPFLGTIVWGIVDPWIIFRAQSLGVFSCAYRIAFVWLPGQSKEWQDRWTADTSANDYEVLSNNISWGCNAVSGVLIILGWIPQVYNGDFGLA